MNNKIITNPNGDFKVEHYETCVICNQHTNVPIDLHIDYRDFYIEGVGQMCKECFDDVYDVDNNEQV